MKTLTVRDVPETVYSALAEWARGNNRSLQGQVRHILQESVRLRATSVMESATTYRARLAGRDLGDSVAEIREDRDR